MGDAAQLDAVWRFYHSLVNDTNSSGDGGDQQVLVHYFARAGVSVHELPADYNAFAWELDSRVPWWLQVRVGWAVRDAGCDCRIRD